MFRELLEKEEYIRQVASKVELPSFDLDLEPFYIEAMKILQPLYTNYNNVAISLWYANRKAVEYRALWAEGCIPPSLAGIVERPRAYVPMGASEWLQPVARLIAREWDWEADALETSYWRYPPSGGECCTPFDLPTGYEWDAESWQYWRIVRATTSPVARP